jgi:ParB family transcriptional regulator, chromosome partitioning protein
MSNPPYFANAAVFAVSVDEVDPDLPGRIGLFFPAKAEALAVLIAANGQNDPIKVIKRGNAAKTPWKLVAGLHRLEACRINNDLVYCIEVSAGGLSAKTAESIQVSENMDRRELAPLEKAMFVHAVADAAKARVEREHPGKSQQQIARASRANKLRLSDIRKADERAASTVDNLSTVYSWKHETAEACGLGQKDVQRSIRIYDCIIAPNRDLIDAFKDHPVAQSASDLLEICKIDDLVWRRRVIETLTGGAADLDFVLRMLKLKAEPVHPDAYSKFSSQMIGAIPRLGTADWRRFCPSFVGALSEARRAELRKALDDVETGQ